MLKRRDQPRHRLMAAIKLFGNICTIAAAESVQELFQLPAMLAFTRGRQQIGVVNPGAGTELLVWAVPESGDPERSSLAAGQQRHLPGG
jgi:hypothetical protein